MKPLLIPKESLHQLAYLDKHDMPLIVLRSGAAGLVRLQAPLDLSQLQGCQSQIKRCSQASLQQALVGTFRHMKDLKVLNSLAPHRHSQQVSQVIQQILDFYGEGPDRGSLEVAFGQEAAGQGLVNNSAEWSIAVRCHLDCTGAPQSEDISGPSLTNKAVAKSCNPSEQLDSPANLKQ